MSQTHVRRAAAVLTLVLSFAWLMVLEPSVQLHPDEDQYIWSAAYFGGKLWQLDMRASGSDLMHNPGWTPAAWWCLTQPMGTRFLFAPVLGLTAAEVPASPVLFNGQPWQGTELEVKPDTRRLIRLAAIMAGALGFALIVLRIGWWAIFPIGVFLAIPDVQHNFVRAWAEGPLLLGFGLGVAAYRTRWFPLACGIAATFKLTALGLWPLVLIPGASGRLRPALALAIAGVSWSILTPPSWFLLGPFYLVLMIVSRFTEYQGQSAQYATIFGLYLPSRYLWPLVLVVLFIATWMVVKIVQQRRMGPMLRSLDARVSRAMNRSRIPKIVSETTQPVENAGGAVLGDVGQEVRSRANSSWPVAGRPRGAVSRAARSTRR